MRTLLIGGTGPTGPHILEGLLGRGHDVTLFHRGVHEPEGLPDVEHLHGDPHFVETIDEAVGDREFDVVLAMYGRLRLIAEFFAGRCDQLVGTTGIAAYRNSLEPARYRPYGMKVLAREDDPLADDDGEAPRFSALILAAERAVLGRSADGGYCGTIVRYPMIYGPRNPVPYEWSVIKRVTDGRKVMLVTDGGLALTTRCAAKNAAAAILAVIDHRERASGQVLNCGDRDQFTLRQWIELVVDALGAELRVVPIPLDIGMATFVEMNPMPDVFPHTFVDTTKIRAELGYRDVIAARDAIAESVDWYVRNPPDVPTLASYNDQFDYDSEDRLLAAYRDAVSRILTDVNRVVPSQHHAMPHPRSPNAGVDHLGR